MILCFLKIRLLPLFLLIPAVVSTATIVSANTVVTLSNKSQYILEEYVSKGSYGVVYFGRAVLDGSPVALKFYGKSDDYEIAATRRFKNLYRSQAGKHVVHILGKGILTDVVGLADPEVKGAEGVVVMERVDGTLLSLVELAKVADNYGLPLKMTDEAFIERTFFLRDLVFQLMHLWAGLASNKLIHQDIKPGNIGYVESPFRIKLLDLDSMEAGPFNNASIISVIQTPGYSAKEVDRFSKKKLKPRERYSSFADLYSIGATLLEIVCNNCSEDELYKALHYWSGRVEPSVETKAALNRLNLVADFIHAAKNLYPENRFIELRDTVLGRFIRFRADHGKPDDYVYLRPRVVVDSPEKLEQMYISAPVEESTQPDFLALKRKRARPKTGLKQKYFRRCAAVLGP